MTERQVQRRQDWRHVALSILWAHLHSQDLVFTHRFGQLTEAEQQQLTAAIAQLSERLTREKKP